MKNVRNSGQSLVELIIVMALLSILVPVIMGAIIVSKNGEAQRINRGEASAFAREAAESVRVIRENSWDSVATAGTYHPVISNSSWALAVGPETVNGLTRSIVISDVYRDVAGAIVTSGGSLDPSTKKVVVTVSWLLPNPSSVTSLFYLTRYLDNLTFTETTELDFTGSGLNLGAFSGTTTSNQSGGEVTLGSGGYGNWCSPNVLNNGANLDGSGIAKGIVALEGKAYTGTGENAAGKSLVGINISSTASPVLPVATEESSFDGHKTNSVYAEGNRAYIGTDTNGREVVILDVGSVPYSEVGRFDTPNGQAGRSVSVSGSVGYVAAGSVLYNFNIADANPSKPTIDSNGVTLSGNISQVVISGSYAYVSIEGSTTREMEIVDISNTSNMQVVGFADIDGSSARDIYINSSATLAYIAAAANVSKNELFIIDIESKTGSRPILGGYDSVGMDPKGVTLVPGNIVILVGNDAEEYQVINVQSKTSPFRCGGAQLDVGINGVDSVLEDDGDAYSYIVVNDADLEFRIVAGGLGGGYSASGTFISKFFDAVNTTAFNYVEAHTTAPNQTTVRYQLAVADAVANDCTNANYVFVGPDGDPSSYYTTEREIFWNDDGIGFENPGRCFKYRVLLESSDTSATPSFDDITINYSP